MIPGKNTRMRLRGMLNRKEFDFEETEDRITYHEGDMQVRCYFDPEGEMTKIEFFEDDDLIEIDLNEVRDRQKKGNGA